MLNSDSGIFLPHPAKTFLKICHRRILFIATSLRRWHMRCHDHRIHLQYDRTYGDPHVFKIRMRKMGDTLLLTRIQSYSKHHWISANKLNISRHHVTEILESVSPTSLFKFRRICLEFLLKWKRLRVVNFLYVAVKGLITTDRHRHTYPL